MVLSDRFAGKSPPSLLKRTLLYVLAFGLGSLLIAGVLSFAMVSIAEGVLPAPRDGSTRDKSDGKDATAKPKIITPSSKSRVTPGDGEADEETDQPL
jgi:hypothetical protein